MFNPIKKIKETFSEDDLEEDDLTRDYDNLETDNMRWELAFDDMLGSYEHALRNERKTLTGKWVQRPGTNPRLNETGITMLISELHPVLNKSIPLSRLEDKFIKEASREKSLRILHKLTAEPKKYGINNLLEIPSLVIDFYLMCYSTMTRALKGKEANMRSKRYKYNENYSHDEVSKDELRGSGGYTL